MSPAAQLANRGPGQPRIRPALPAASVEVEGPLGVQSVDARASDALNLATLISAPVFVSAEVMDDSVRRQEEDSAEARLLRLAPTVLPMTITREKP
jgi:Bifunctional nuclease domain